MKMLILHLHLVKFRNYQDQKFEFHTDVNAFVGKNGMGKTNVLEAIYYLCFGKSYFTSSDKIVINLEGEFFRVSGEFLNGCKKEVIIKYKANGKKEIEVLGKKIDRVTDHIGQFPCVIVAPNDISTLLDSSEDRRNFINNTIVQSDPVYLKHLLQYTHLLKQRNALLKSFAENKTFDNHLLDAVTEGMYRPAVYIHEQRKVFFSRIIPHFNHIYHDITGGNEGCNVIYTSKLDHHRLEDLMKENLSKDRILCRTSQGIHKDDLDFRINNEPLKHYASQGQLKSFILSLKLAQYKIIEDTYGNKPIILLDDIFDKLDPNRVLQLMHVLKKNSFGQIFITDTQESRVRQVLEDSQYQYKIFKINSGQIEE